MPTKPMVKTLWLIIAAAFLIGLGLSGLGFALGGNAPVGFGPGGMRFVDFRTGMVYNSRMEPREVDSDWREGVICASEIDTIRVESVSADIVIVPTAWNTEHEGMINYSIRPEGSLTYSTNTAGGVLEIRPAHDTGFFGFENINFSWREKNLDGEIIIEVPLGMRFDRINLQSVAGSINASILDADVIQLTTVSGPVDIGVVGNASDFANRLELTSVSGNVLIHKSYVNNLDLSQISGRSNIALAMLDDFSITSSSISASVVVGEDSIGRGSSQFGRGSRSADIATISGDVTLKDASLSSGALEDQPIGGVIPLGMAIESAEEDLVERGISATFYSDSGLSLEDGRWVWELLFEAEGERMPLIEYYIDASSGEIVKFEWDD